VTKAPGFAIPLMNEMVRFLLDTPASLKSLWMIANIRESAQKLMAQIQIMGSKNVNGRIF